ncbi:DUF4936 family protein [Herbaspirillum sp. GCM10030257]|uniref:DUF4936 family protein n=1 Tax=Herbaspirillum sp. GCM10030257 TaxID=3273393 RepID=UPI00360E47B6
MHYPPEGEYIEAKTSMDLYIYYRVASSDAPQLQTRAEAMQQSLSREYGIVSRLKRRPAETDGMQTWMEVYLSVPADFEAVLERAVTDTQLNALIHGPRHTEHFVDVSSCA